MDGSRQTPPLTPAQSPHQQGRTRGRPGAQMSPEKPQITHPEKVLFPVEHGDAAITKGELAAYYEAVAPVMVPHIRARPITMERYHRGITAPGFFQKDV